MVLSWMATDYPGKEEIFKTKVLFLFSLHTKTILVASENTVERLRLRM